MSTDSDEVRRVVKGHVNCLINKLSKIVRELHNMVCVCVMNVYV